MYKYLLCWRYLRTRYIALASIVSVMLGVATMIVVNSVMAGFSNKMRDRLHGVLADIEVRSVSFNGFHNPDEVMALVREVAGDKVLAMSPVVETYGILTMFWADQAITRQVRIFGIRPEDQARTGEFAQFLVDERGRRRPPSFAVDPQLRERAPSGSVLKTTPPDDPLFHALEQDALTEVPDFGAIVGYAAATQHMGGGRPDLVLAPVGTKVMLTFADTARPPKPQSDGFTVVSYFKSDMSEYDATHVYVPLERLQFLRGLGEGERAAVNQIQLKVRPGVDLDELAQTLRLALYRKWPRRFDVQTWEQQQGPLLAAVAIEQNILNILLFFIIAVAGFGILAIFSMIVVEKTRDIGVLKALGASTSGVRGIFLGYGLSLGLVGSGVGMAGGLLFVRYINDIERGLSLLTGQRVFNPDIYYFDGIPTLVQPWTVAWIVGGALLIAVAASVWPAQRASRLHPVQALRFE
jgi:lipoprotein-releasing system permease protein